MTTTSNEHLIQQVIGFAADPQRDFLPLASALAGLLDRDPLQFKALIGASGLGVRKAYFLVNISRAFDPLSLPKARLQALGWVKLLGLASHIDAGNAEALLKMAEANSAADLRKRVSVIEGGVKSSAEA